MKMWMKGRGWGLAIAMLGLLALPLAAQQGGAAITGTVTDTSGAAIPGAKVTLTSQQQGTHYTTSTNGSGIYNLPSIPTGTYTIAGSARGFQTTKQGPFTLVLNQSAKVNLKLTVGQQSQVVSVTGQAPLLQTQSTETQTTLNSAANVALPMLSRNYSQLSMLTPGVTTPDPNSTFSAGGNGADIYINGNRGQDNNFLLGGVDNNQTTDNTQGYAPSPDAISQFTVISSNPSAVYGNFAGGVISAEIKSGTNNWHGDLYEFVQNDKLNANQWSNNFVAGAERAKVRYNNFGGTVGGPILHNKLFIFGDYEGIRNDTPNSTGGITLLTPAEQQGDFSALCGAAGGTFNGSGLCSVAAGQLYDPNNVVNGKRQAYANNMIPTSEESPVVKALFASSLWPTNVGDSLTNNYLQTTRSFTNTNQGDVRVDYNIDSTNHLFWRGSMMRQSNETGESSFLLIPATTTPAHDWSSVLDWTHTIGGNFVNDAKVGLNYVGSNGSVVGAPLGNFAADIGITDGNNRGPGLPGLNFTQSTGTTFSGNGGGGAGLTSLGNADDLGLRGTTVLTFADQMVITEGTNEIEVGAQYMRYRSDYYYGANDGLFGNFAFNGQYTSDNASTSPTPGYEGADFFLGLPASLGQGPGNNVFGQRKNVFGAYLQDNWHMAPNFTWNLGLRYQYFGPLYEVYDRELNVSPVTGTLYTAGTQAARSFYGAGGMRSLYRPYNGPGNWQPRLGFSWQPVSNTVVRAGYGISSYMEGTGLNLRPTTNPPYGTDHSATYSATDNLPGSTLADGFAPFATTGTSLQDLYHNVSLRVWAPDVQPAIIEQWNFNVQRQLSNSTTVQIGYVGEHGTHETTPEPLQELVLPSDCAANGGMIDGVACGNAGVSLSALQSDLSVKNGPVGVALTNGTLAPSPFLSGNSLLLSAIGNVGADATNTPIVGTFTNGDHTYNALQLMLQHRFANGLEYQGSYTWSKCMSDSGGFYGDGGQTSAGGEVYPQDMYQQNLEFGPCFNDTTNLISAYVVYSLPFGANSNYDLGPVGNQILGHWQVSGTWNWHTGFAFSPTAANETGSGASACCRADCNGPAIYSKSSSPAGGIQWIANNNSFTTGDLGQLPTCGRGVLRGPGIDVFNFSLMRNIPVGGESRHLQLRADFNNLWNHPILNAPDSGVGNNFGLIQGSQGARVVELAVKYYF